MRFESRIAKNIKSIDNKGDAAAEEKAYDGDLIFRRPSS